MKKILLASCCMIAALLMFNACNSGKDSANSKSNPLVGSTWMASSTQIDTLRDSVFIFTADVVLKFQDDTTGVMFSDHRVFMNNQAELAEDKPQRTPFTYSFDNTEGKMVLNFEGQVANPDMPKLIENTFKYDEKENTITTFAPNKKKLEVYTEVK